MLLKRPRRYDADSNRPGASASCRGYADRAGMRMLRGKGCCPVGGLIDHANVHRDGDASWKLVPSVPGVIIARWTPFRSVRRAPRRWMAIAVLHAAPPPARARTAC